MKTAVLFVLILAVSFAAKNQSTMQATGPADALLDHLAVIQTDIREEQFQHDQLYNTQHQECEDEFTARTTAIVDGEDSWTRAKAHHARCNAAYAEAEADLTQVRAYQAEIDSILTTLEIKRNEQREDFDHFINEEVTPAIAAVQGAYPIIDSFSVGDASFLEVTNHMGRSFKALVKAGKGAAMAAPLSALVALGQDFNQEQINEVRSLFEKLEADLLEAKQAAIDLEKERQQVYDATVAEYEQILSNLSQSEADLVQYSADMAACVTQESQIIDQAAKKVRNNREALKYAIQMCSAFEEEYQNATAGRSAELELLEKLSGFIQEQAELFGDYGPESSGVFDAYRQQYEESLNEQVDGFIQMRAKKNSEHLQRMRKALQN